MADYLSSLIAKNLSLQEKIEPRLPARFEPSQEARLADPFQEGAQAVEQIDEPASEPPVGEARHPQDEPSSEPVRPRVRENEEWQSNAHSHVDMYEPEHLDQPYRGRMDVPERVETVREVMKVGMDGPGDRTAEAEPTNFPGTTKVVTTSEREVMKVVVKSASETAVAEPANTTRTAEAVTTNSAKSAPVRSDHFSGSATGSLSRIHPQQPQAQQPSSIPAPEPATSELRPTVPPLPDLAPRNLPEPPAPTIHVSIGRIEVRATPASTPPARKPSSEPKIMSLDEYLQSRSNGGGS